MDRRLVVVDPGKRTGVCFVEPQLGSLSWTLDSGTPMIIVGRIENWIKYRAPVTVVVERFTVTSVKHTRQYDALEVIGALRYLAWREGATFALQSRADRMRVPLDVARRFAQPKNDDEESALRHAVVSAVVHSLIDPVHFVVRSTEGN